jgi:23S rRNA (cytidine1920-2'-O)/16S rRNA (cytidine1409-2'-O)-methyltransferase
VDAHQQYASRGGLKLAAALEAFHLDPQGLTCADLGSNVGGFVDCLLQRGAAKVYAIDTGYGTLAWKLRRDARVIVMERTNALHVTLPESVELVTIDVGWTPQHHILPAARRLLRPGGHIVTLIKPHYEADKTLLRRGVLEPQHAHQVVGQVRSRIESLDLLVSGVIESPVLGQKGNIEFLALVEPSQP